MPRMKLKDNHPTQVKLDKLTDLADELGISLYFQSGYCIVRDRDQEKEFSIEDIEGEGIVFSFPHGTETKTMIRGT